MLRPLQKDAKNICIFLHSLLAIFFDARRKRVISRFFSRLKIREAEKTFKKARTLGDIWKHRGSVEKRRLIFFKKNRHRLVFRNKILGDDGMKITRFGEGIGSE